MSEAPGVGRLEVRSRQLVSGVGTATEFTVYCPFRQRSLELDACEECFAYDGTRDDAEGTPIEIACRRIGPALDLPDVVEAAAREVLETTPVSRVMARHVVCVQADVPLSEVAAILLRHRISGVPVLDDEFQPIGMVSKTDLVRRGFALGEGTDGPVPDAPGAVPESGCVAHVMTRSVASVGERASLMEAAQRMAAQGVHRIAVTGHDGRIVGLVSSLDVLRWITRELPAGEGVAGAVEPD